MFTDAMIRRRAALDEPIPKLNARMVERLVAVPGFWGEGKTAADAPNDFKGEGAALDLRKALRPGLSGQALYVPRFAGYLSRDIGMADDFLNIRLDIKKIDYAEFCSTTLPRLIEVFGPYRAVMQTDKAIALDDWDIACAQSKKTGRNEDGRDSVHRIWPVCFFDDLLCQRAFGIEAQDVVRRAASECERAEFMHDGAFLLVTSEIVVGEALNALNARVMARLGVSTAARSDAG